MGRFVTCGDCGGDGRVDGHECPTCRGIGEFELGAEEVPQTSIPGSVVPLYAPPPGWARSLANAVMGILALLILLIPVGWWSEAAGAIRSLLEALPLGDAVAERPNQDGSPVLVGALTTALVAAAIALATVWRRRTARNYVWGGVTFVHLYFVSVIRTLVIFGGVSLIPNVVAVAHGTDLRSEPEQTFTGPAWAIVIVLFWATFSYYGLRDLVDRAAARPPRPDAPEGGRAGRLSLRGASGSISDPPGTGSGGGGGHHE